MVSRVPRAEVRRRLIDAAVEVFGEQGYDGTRLEDVAARAGFTKGAVYSNFAGKDDLFAALITERVTDQADQMVALIAEGGPQAMDEELGREFAADTVWSQLHLEISVRAARDEDVRAVYAPRRRQMRAQLTELLADNAGELGLHPEDDVALLSLTAHALALGLDLERAVDPGSVTEQDVRNAFALIVTRLTAGSGSTAGLHAAVQSALHSGVETSEE